MIASTKQDNFSDEFLKALGRVCVNFQALEMDIAWLVWILNNPDTTLGQIMTSQVSFKALLAVSSSLFRYRVTNDSLGERLAELLKRASDVEQRRNTLINSIWFADDSGASSALSSKRDKSTALEFRTKVLTPSG